MAEAEYYSELDAAFSSAVASLREAGPLAVLFSGGVDSGLLAWELRTMPGLELITVGVEGSADLRAAQDAAAIIGARWTPFEVTPDDVGNLARGLEPDVAGLPHTPRAVLIAFGLALAQAPAGPVICGQGADELFLGYSHFRGLSAAAALARVQTDLRLLTQRDWPRAQRIGARLGRVALAPYLDPRFVDAASSVPIDARMPDPTVKGFFRKWAMHRGLPETIASRPKKALQFGTGIDRVVRRTASLR
jgi:asparagine synthase (glutamine-hydrolysing)